MARLVAAVLEAAPKGRVLDGGCGSGAPARWLAAGGCDVLAIDTELPSELAGTAEAVGDGRIEWRREDLFDLADSERFAAVCLFGVLHYAGSADRIRDLLRCVARRLDAGGLLALTWITDRIPLAGRDAFLPPAHLVQDMLADLGFHPARWWEVEIEHTHGGWGLHRHQIAYGTWLRSRKAKLECTNLHEEASQEASDARSRR